MPELYLADALGAAGKPMLRVHTAGSVGGSTAIVAASLIQAGIHERVLTVAFEKQSESNAMWALTVDDAVPAVGRRRRGRLLRAAHPRLHAPLGRARRHRHPRRAEGPPQRAQESVRAPARSRTSRFDDDRGLADAVGSDPLPRDVSVVRRRLRDGARRRGAAREARRTSRPGCTRTAMRSEPTHVRRPRPGEPAGRSRLRGGRSTRRPASPIRASEIDVAEIYVPFSWFEPMWMENLGFAPEGEGWKMTYEGATALDGDMPINCSGGVLSPQPDRRVGHDPLRRGGDAGARPGRRAPGRRRAASRSATPTAAARSSSRCGSSGATKPVERCMDVQSRRPLRVRRRRRARAHRARRAASSDAPSRSSIGARTSCAHALVARGVERGRRTSGSTLMNGAEYVEAMIGCFKLRAVPVNVNYRYVEDELRYLLDDADAVARDPPPQLRAAPRRGARPPAASCARCSRSTTAAAPISRATRLRGLRVGARRRQHRRATSPSARPTTSSSSTPAARRACRRA